MNKIIKNILTRIENEGYEAYIVGGYVRDYLLNKNTFDIDICTNALPKDLVSIFPKTESLNNYGGFNFKIKQYNIDITTYRKEIKYNNRKPVEIEYISNLIEDIKRRDFTINALCMDKNDNIIDILNGKEDLNNKIIRSLGDPDIKFKEDPLRMLRAIRFASILDFDIEENTYKAIENNYMLIDTLSSERIKEELIKILSNPNFKKGLELLDKLNISRIIGLSYNNVVYTADILGMLSQINIKKVQLSNQETETIKDLKEIYLRSEINSYTLFKFGLYTCTVAGEVLGVDKNTINKMYSELPIKSMKDIDIDGKEIMNILNLEPSKKISDIINDVKNKILANELKNKKNEIKKYILERWKNE